MNILNHAWLGYAPTPESAIAIIQETGAFYVAVSCAYLFAFFHTLWGSSLKQMKGTHWGNMAWWAATGIGLLYQPNAFSLFVNMIAVLLSLAGFYQLHYISALMSRVALDAHEIETDHKKALYGKYLLKKKGVSLREAFGFSLINEQILWMLIFYKAAIALRASFAL